VEEFLEVSYYPGQEDPDQTYIAQKAELKRDSQKVGTVGPWETYFGVLKAYCAISILIIPKAFTNGGYIFSPLCILVSAFITTVCALKLVDAGLYVKIFNYSAIVKLALGRKMKVLLDIMLVLT